MKKITLLCSLTLCLLSCKKIVSVSDIQNTIPDKIGSAIVAPTPTSGHVTMSFNLQPQTQYNVTIQGMNGKVYKSYGINSVDGKLIKQDNLSDLQSGNYDLILMNINGSETRTPIIKK